MGFFVVVVSGSGTSGGGFEEVVAGVELGFGKGVSKWEK